MRELSFINTRAGMTVLFWGMALWLVPLFAQMYGCYLVLFIWLLTRVFGELPHDYAGPATTIMTLVCVGMGLATVIWLWTKYKKHFIDSLPRK